MDETTKPRNVVTLSGCDVTLIPPGISSCRDVADAVISNRRRAAVAALALCWPSTGKTPRGGIERPALTYAQANHNALEYGGQFNDALEAAGVDHEEILSAGVVALLLCFDQLPRPQEEQRAEGNS